MDKYPLLLRILHWVVAILAIAMIIVGLYMAELRDEDPSRATFYSYHKSTGVLILVLMIFRVVIRVFSYIPPLPAKFLLIEKLFAKLGHYLLYLFLLTAAISGFSMSMLSGKGILFFGYKVPDFLPLDKATAGLMHTIHVTLPSFFIALIILHICATIYHYIKQKVNILNRII